MPFHKTPPTRFQVTSNSNNITVTGKLSAADNSYDMQYTSQYCQELRTVVSNDTNTTKLRLPSFKNDASQQKYETFGK